MKVISLKCVGCSAPLEGSVDAYVYFCSYCGTRNVIERDSAFRANDSWRKGANQSVSPQDSRSLEELELARLKKELANIEGRIPNPQEPVIPSVPRPEVRRPPFLDFLSAILPGAEQREAKRQQKLNDANWEWDCYESRVVGMRELTPLKERLTVEKVRVEGEIKQLAAIIARGSPNR